MSKKTQDEFEYNDGLGDLLREKRRRKFSWTRSGLMLMIVMLAVFAGLTLLFNLVKPLFVTEEPVIKNLPAVTELTKPETVTEKPGAAMSEEDVQTKIARIEAENLALISKLEEAKKSAKKIPVTTSAPVVIKKVVVKKPVVAKVKVVKSEPVVVKVAYVSTGSYHVFAGAFGTRENAEIQKKQLANLQIDSLIMPFEKNGQTLFRVQVSEPKTHADAVALVGKLQKKGIAAYANSK